MPYYKPITIIFYYQEREKIGCRSNCHILEISFFDREEVLQTLRCLDNSFFGVHERSPQWCCYWCSLCDWHTLGNCRRLPYADWQLDKLWTAVILCIRYDILTLSSQYIYQHATVRGRRVSYYHFYDLPVPSLISIKKNNICKLC